MKPDGRNRNRNPALPFGRSGLLSPRLPSGRCLLYSVSCLLYSVSCLLSSSPASASTITERVALVPVNVNTDAGNGARMTEALLENIARHGAQVVPTEEMRRAIRAMGIPLDKPISQATLTALGRKVGADLVVYVRLLVQGPTIKSVNLNRGRQAFIIHMLMVDARTGGLLPGNEILQEWDAADPLADRQTASSAAATEAADKLLSKLYAPTTVQGQLIDQTTGKPVTEAEVFLYQDGLETRVAATDERGAFTFREPAQGSYTIATRAPRYYSVTRVVPITVVQPNLVLGLVSRTASLIGKLRDAAGNPIAAAAITVSDNNGRQVNAMKTLSDGSFGCPGLGAGVYSVVAILPNGKRIDRKITLAPGDIFSLDFRVP